MQCDVDVATAERRFGHQVKDLKGFMKCRVKHIWGGGGGFQNLCTVLYSFPKLTEKCLFSLCFREDLLI